MKNSISINQRLLNIIQNDFDGCEWFIIASNDLMNTLNKTIDLFNDNTKTFNYIKNHIGKIGIEISNVEKCLEAVEECYNKLVEALSVEFESKKISQ